MKKNTLLTIMLLYSIFGFSQTIIIGTGTDNTDGTGADPVSDYYNSERYQVVYTAAELSAAMTPYDELTGLGFSVSELGGTLLSYSIRIGHTSAINSSVHDLSPTSIVKTAFDYTPTVTVAGVFDMINFDSNFVWNGVDNIVIDICTAGSNPFGGLYGGVRTTNAVTDGSRSERVDGASACGNPTDTANANKPNIQFSYIDGTPPACLPPNTLTAIGITTVQANLGWTTGGSGETMWDVEYGATPFAPTGTPTSGATTGIANPFTLTGLTSGTTYEYYVRADCGGSQSTWSGPFSFTTLPDYCGGDNFYDDGGVAGNYSDGITDGTTVICPDIAGDVVTVTFNSLDLESCCDDLAIYDGNGTGGTLLGTFDGSSLPGPFTSTDPSGCLTFVFNSDGSVNDLGWDATITCALPPSCLAPTVLTATSITDVQADLGWTTGGSGETMWDIEYGATPFAPTGTPTSGATTGIANPFTLTGLTSGTTYEYYVRANCGGSQSTWSGPFSFTTLPDYCGGDNFYDDGGVAGNYSDGITDGTTVICPDIAGDVVTVTFNSLDLESCCDDLAIYDGNGTGGTLLGTFDGSSLPGPFTSTDPSGCLTFVFNSDGSVNDLGWDATITCALPPSCLAPTVLTATSITDVQADLGWTTGGSGETMWDIEYGATPFAPTGTPTSGATTGIANPFTLTGLTAETTYEYYVRADCGGSQSAWAGPFSLTTACAIVTPNYLNDFTVFPGNCWEEGNDTDIATGPNNTDGAWVIDDFINDTGHAFGNSARINLWNLGDSDWLVSQTFDLSAGSYGMSIDVAVTEFTGGAAITMGSDDEVHVLISNDDGVTWIPLEVFNTANSPSNTGDHKIYDLAAYTSATTKFAFWGTEGIVNDTEDFNFYVDNFNVDLFATLGVQDLQELEGFRYYPNPTNNTLNISAQRNIENIQIVNMLGQVVKTAQPNLQSYRFDMTDLASGVYFIKASVNNVEGTFKIVKQ